MSYIRGAVSHGRDVDSQATAVCALPQLYGAHGRLSLRLRQVPQLPGGGAAGTERTISEQEVKDEQR